MSLAFRDKCLLWHPFTQAKTAPEVLAIERASGAYLYDESGKAYLDMISSWWVNIHGHAHPTIAQQIAHQAATLEHVIFAGCTHTPAVALCESLSSLLPSALSRFFFSDNGSTCIEVASKMAFQYWHNLGYTEKKYFLNFEGGYHGDTLGAMSLGHYPGHDLFRSFGFSSFSIPYPDTWHGDMAVDEKEHHALLVLDRYLKKDGDHIVAMILEPLIQGAMGMRMCRPDFLIKVVERLRQAQIFIIFDEVMTGFGRTGPCFAYEHLGGLYPDFLCVSKGITGGFLPLSLTITTNTVYEAFWGDDFTQAFAHGHSYTANPIACSAALESLRLLKEKACALSRKQIESAHYKGMALLSEQCSLVTKVRILGTVAACEINVSSEVLSRFIAGCWAEGLLVRPLGKVLYFLPPYCITEAELLSAYQLVISVLNYCV